MDVIEEKECSKCLQVRPFSDFTKAKYGKYGLGSRCLECRQERNRELTRRRRADPDLAQKNRDAANKYYRTHRPVKAPMDPFVYKDRVLMRKYGISLEEYNRMYLEQEGLCAICKEPERPYASGKTRALAVDHDHKTGAVRKLLCFRCNMKLGWVEDHLSVILEYLG